MPEKGSESGPAHTPAGVPMSEAWAATPDLDHPISDVQKSERLVEVLKLADAQPKKRRSPELEFPSFKHLNEKRGTDEQ